MQKTRFERLEIGGPDTAVFRIAGKLGFHENVKVEQLIDECLKRNFQRVVFDFSELTSLGGGVAKLLRKFVGTFEGKGGSIRFVVTRDVVLDFLRDEETRISAYKTLDEALNEPESMKSAQDISSVTGDIQIENSDMQDAAEDMPERQPRKEGISGDQEIILMAYDGGEGSGEAEVAGENAPEEKQSETAEDIQTTGIISEIFESPRQDGSNPPDWIEAPVSPFDEKNGDAGENETNGGDINRKLKRRILELKTLFSISEDFNSIKDRKKLLDIFLLTSIAQGGVESAAFYEKKEEFFEPVLSKGLDSDNLGIVKLTGGYKGGADDIDVVALEDFALEGESLAGLRKAGFEYVCPFNGKDGPFGFVTLGKRITGRGMKKEDFEFMKILVNVAKGAYQNAVMLEHEHERTLGIVKTLISLIEENTLLKGTSEFVSRYVGMVAKDLNYSDEHFKDLIYGTVLRDIGMVKVSDLILRSPRELTKEEWGIIKKHPEDGAEMLRRMKFNNHVVEIVMSHHERFNGEGYPRGMRGKEIPLGARIISVVESYAAMIHERPNRAALSEKEALETLKENYGLRYDREVAASFAKIIEKEIAKSIRPGVPVS